ncbi:long-chain acyl-CoA synthetase [Pseudomonas sp. JAI111]|uniref:AMP-binding protein n=1 Tax=Pseudomonas sp. JAI111 TaxID=2735913 RepID=UPI0021684818|nr:AMP-binding protein [Pseudomonas sp. JAI111]MCS3835756.1 long-chain acyl-CoA synthetase [Pseudomonas sp. JAI111]
MSQRPWYENYGDLPIEIDADVYPSVLAMMEAAMVEFADRPAFKCFGQTLSYRDVDRLSRNFAAYLQSCLGVRKGDRVALMTPNFMAYPIAFLGIVRAGAVLVNVNPLYTARELEHQLRDAGAEIIIVFNGVSATVAEVVSQSGAQSLLRAVVTISPGDGTAATLSSPPVDACLQRTISFEQALADGDSLHFVPVGLGGEDLLFLQYTGGTTGLSKGAALSHRNLVANVQQFKAVVADNLRPGEEVIVTAIPLYHIFALMVNFITYFSVGAENWLVPNPRDMNGLIDVLKASRCTVFTGVNTLFAGVVAHPRVKEIDFSRLRMSAGGGSAILEPTSTKWKALSGCFIREGYGMSETSPVISFNLASAQRYNGTTGVPLPSTDVILLKEDGAEAAQGDTGEVCVRGPQVMRGYWQQSQANAEAFTTNGYFRTGDVGLFTSDGLLKLVDRKKDMIIVSGFNVFPNEIEGVAAACPGVLECACVGVPDEKTGEAAKLYVVRAPGEDISVEQIVEHCRRQLTAYKVPKLMEFVEALPKSTVGKILRRELRQTV